MGRKGRPTAPEMVTRLTELGVEVLVEQLGLTPERAQAAVRELAYRFCSEYGGQRVSIPMDIQYPLDKRDDAMWLEFNGRNVPELAAKFGRTVQQVRNILAHKRRQEEARRQYDLLAEEQT